MHRLMYSQDLIKDRHALPLRVLQGDIIDIFFSISLRNFLR
jgi:hypothetical protein